MSIDIILGILDGLSLLYLSFNVGRIYEFERGFHKKAYKELLKDTNEFVDFLHDKLPKLGIPITKEDGSVVSPYYINKK